MMGLSKASYEVDKAQLGWPILLLQVAETINSRYDKYIFIE